MRLGKEALFEACAGRWKRIEFLNDVDPLNLLEDRKELLKAVHFQQLLALWRGREFGVFQYPGVFVEEEDRVQPGGQGGIDVALDAVADHPTGMRRQFMAMNHVAIGRLIFLGHNLNR